jgi:shikimate kinase
MEAQSSGAAPGGRPAPVNVVLLGFMGTGKSTTGRLIADRLGLGFVDMDHEIERRDGRVISAIFATSGEAYFRDRESEVARELAGRSGLVIAAGGGVVLNPDNTRVLGVTGVLVCLTARPETILERVGRKKTRPLLLEADPLARIRQLLAARQALYDAIPHRVATDGLAAETVADQVVAVVRAAGLRAPA